MVAALAAACAFGCAKPTPPETTVLAKVPERVVILPLNVTRPMPAELKRASPIVWSALEIYLRAHGTALKTLSFPAARDLWDASVRDAQADQQLRKAGFDDAARIFVGKLKPYADFDALIVPSLFVQRAILSGTTARWDGTEQMLEVDAGRKDAPIPADAPIEGAAPAASLHAAVFSAEGAKLQDAQAGLALLVRARISHPNGPTAAPRFSFIARRELFEDRVSLLRGIASALAPFLPRLPDSVLREQSERISREARGSVVEGASPR